MQRPRHPPQPARAPAWWTGERTCSCADRLKERACNTGKLQLDPVIFILMFYYSNTPRGTLWTQSHPRVHFSQNLFALVLSWPPPPPALVSSLFPVIDASSCRFCAFPGKCRCKRQAALVTNRGARFCGGCRRRSRSLLLRDFGVRLHEANLPGPDGAARNGMRFL